MTATRRAAFMLLGALLATWLTATVGGSGAPRLPSSASTPRSSADGTIDRARARATATPRPATNDGPHPRAAHEPSSLGNDPALSAEPFTPAYGEEVSAEERVERDALRSDSQARAFDLEQRWAADADSDGAMELADRIRTLAEERGVAPDVLTSIECRATLCRVEVALGDPTVMANLPRVAAQLGARYWMRQKPGNAPGLDVILERRGQKPEL